MTFEHFESGRSMVEMLGVLAVVGVLSIGGIMGYSYGMDKYRANQTMQEITLRGIDVLAQYDRTGDANLNEWQNEKTIYPITLEEDTIGIQVDEVPERVCEMITEGMTHVATGIKVNGTYAVDDGNTCDGDENSLVFYFDEEGEKNTGPNFPEEEDKEICGDSVCGECEVCDESTQTCVPVIEKAETISDFACTTVDGAKSYCGILFGGTGCLEHCSECELKVNGSCLVLDSTEYLMYGLGGFGCTKDGKDGYCMSGVCQVPGDSSVCEREGTDAECMTNLGGTCVLSEGIIQCTANGYNGYCSSGQCLPSCDNCTDNQYCGDLNTSYTSAHPMVCKNLDFSEYSIDGKIYYISNNDMSWWDNEAACVALSKKTGKTLSMISLSELLTGYNGSKWEGVPTKTALLEELYVSIGSKWLWTKDLINSYEMFYVLVGGNQHGYGGTERNDTSRGVQAICR
ncbi:MAG: hypothetical protein IKY98_04295 [Alphaproteobacteria bacterium]|nr:hypothetical protein [Alphaproteobacteria bacterium]